MCRRRYSGAVRLKVLRDGALVLAEHRPFGKSSAPGEAGGTHSIRFTMCEAFASNTPAKPMVNNGKTKLRMKR